MYAVIRTGGKQYRVQQGDRLRVEHLDLEIGTKVSLEQVLLLAKKDQIEVGSPLITGAKVDATVQSVGREKKIEVIKFRRRKDSSLKQGHRQYYTELKIDKISKLGSKSAQTATKTSKTRTKTSTTATKPSKAKTTKAKQSN